MKSVNTFTRKMLLRIFKNRCVLCQKVATDVHEIVPRSQMKDWDNWENQVTLCKDHHFWVHDNGPQNAAPLLKAKRKARLIAYHGTSDYEAIRELCDIHD